MGGGVCGVHKLAGDEAIRNLLGKLLRLGNSTLHALGTLCKHQLRAIGLHQLATLYAHGLRHDDDNPIAPGSRHGSQANARIAGGRLDNDTAGLQGSLGLGVVDHSLGDPILYGTGRVEILQLCQNLGLQLQFLFQVGQLQQGGLSDQLIGGSINFRHNGFLPKNI